MADKQAALAQIALQGCSKFTRFAGKSRRHAIRVKRAMIALKARYENRLELSEFACEKAC